MSPMQALFTYISRLLIVIIYSALVYGKWLNVRISNEIIKKEGHICSYKRLPRGTYYAVKFEPRISELKTMQMFIFGCSNPKHYRKHWRCDRDTPCKDQDDGERLIYTWNKNNHALEMPENVGFKVGRRTESKYFVIKIIYSIDNHDETSMHSNSDRPDGVDVYLTSSWRKYVAGIYIFSAEQYKVPRKEKEYHIDVGCRYRGRRIVPFRFWCQTNIYGSIASAFLVQNGGNWNLIGKCIPHRSLFNDIPKNNMLLVKPGDILATRCSYVSPQNKTQFLAEQLINSVTCEFYMMYYMRNPGRSTEYEEACDSVIQRRINFPKEANINFTEITSPSLSSSKLPKTSKKPPVLKTNGFSQQVITERKAIHKIHSKHVNSKPISDIFGSKNMLIAQRMTDRKGNNSVCDIFSLDLNIYGMIASLCQSRKIESDLFDDEYYYTGSLKPIEKHVLLNINPISGKVVKSFGKNIFYLPHGFFVDHENNYWVTDLGLHQVVKLSYLDRENPSLMLGKALFPGYDDEHFCQPTDVVVDRYGNVFVADGYCNSRIMKFDSSGKFMTKWEGSVKVNKNHGDDDYGHFTLPYSLSIDHNYNHLYVLDLENGCILKFDTDGEFILKLKHSDGSRLFAIDFSNAFGGSIFALSELHKESGAIIYGVNSHTGELLTEWRLGNLNITHPYDISVSHNDKVLFVSSKSGLWKFDMQKLQEISIKETTQISPVLESGSYKPIEIVDPDNDDDDISVLPAVVVVTVLAIPVFLIIIAMIVQHVIFKCRKNKVTMQRLRRKNFRMPKNDICFGCCVTRKHYYDGNRGLDSFLPDHSSNESDFDEENLFAGKV